MSLFQTLVPALGRVARPAGQGEAKEAAPAVKPHYEVRETGEAYGLVVQLPGVAREGLELSAEEGLLIISGRRDWKAPAAWSALYRESSGANFELSLRHDNAIDVDNIQAELRDGVLRVSLPKAESLKPRKIAVG